MSIEQDLTTKLKEAMRAKNSKEISVIRMVKTQATKDMTVSGFDGNTDDGFWQGVIERYVKQQKKALAEYEKLGSEGQSQADELRFEIEYLAPFLPQMMSEAEVEAIVDAAIAETGVSDIKMMGKVMGAVMKNHKGSVDGALVKQVIQRKLG